MIKKILTDNHYKTISDIRKKKWPVNWYLVSDQLLVTAKGEILTSRHNLRLRFGLYLHVSLFYLCVSFYPNGTFGSAHLTHVNRLYAIICANAM